MIPTTYPKRTTVQTVSKEDYVTIATVIIFIVISVIVFSYILLQLLCHRHRRASQRKNLSRMRPSPRLVSNGRTPSFYTLRF
nr:protein m120 [Murid betaherpesvirus 2]